MPELGGSDFQSLFTKKWVTYSSYSSYTLGISKTFLCLFVYKTQFSSIIYHGVNLNELRSSVIFDTWKQQHQKTKTKTKQNKDKQINTVVWSVKWKI